MIAGKLVRDGGDTGDTGDTFNRHHLILNSTITGAAQTIAEYNDLDINNDHINSQRITNLLRKMRLERARQARSGKRGWVVSG